MSNNKQGSVVDFIYNELFVGNRWMDLTNGDIEYIFKQSKAMHKDEIIKAMSVAFIDGAKIGGITYESPYEDWAEYYNETFGGNNE